MFKRVAQASFIGTLGAFMLVPEEHYPGRLKPIAHMYNVAKAGALMTRVYSGSQGSIEEKHREASQYLKQALRKNGGVYIKLGQLIATIDVIVPDQYRQTMMELTRGCDISTYDNVKAIIEEATGKPIDQTFKQFSKQPLSSASIGQVHKAMLVTGEQVAVKVQHQNLAENVNMDIELMWAFVKIGKLLFKEFKFQWLIDQFEKNIKRQLDFRLQAVNIKKVNQMIAKQKLTNVYVPKLLLPAAEKLLVMQYIHGFHIDELQKMKRAGIDAKKIGKLFSQVIIKMIHKYGFVHADPHSGNMLVRKDRNGKDQLVLLDHGLYQELDEQTRLSYNWFWLGLIIGDEDMSVAAAQKLGTRNGVLLCSMLTSQTRQELRSPGRNLFDLNPSTDKKVIMKHAKQWQSQIVTLLNEIQREILLLLKVNEFARTIENMLGGRETGVYEDLARCCVDNLPISRWQRAKYKWLMLRAALGI